MQRTRAGLLVAALSVLLLCTMNAASGVADTGTWISGTPDAVRSAATAGALGAPGKDGKTPLMHAAEHNIPESVAVLLELGADPNARTVTNVTPLMFAALGNKRCKEVIALLLAFGADVDAVDSKGRSALLLASAYSKANREEAVIALLHGGANPFLEDNTGRKAMDYARNNTRLTNTHARTMLAQYADRSTGLYKVGSGLPAKDAPKYSAPESPNRNGSGSPEPSRPALPQEEPPLRTAPAVITTDDGATMGAQVRNDPPPGSLPEETTQTDSPFTVKPEPQKPERQPPEPATAAAIDWEQWALKIFGLIAVLIGLAIAVIKYRTAVLENKTKRASLNK